MSEPGNHWHLKRCIVDAFKYRDFAKCLELAANFSLSPNIDASVSTYQAFSMMELGRREEALQIVRSIGASFPREVVAIASGVYLSRRLRVADGFDHEDGWIAMLEVLIASGLLKVRSKDLVTSLNESLPRTIPNTIVQFWDKKMIPDDVHALMEINRLSNPDWHHAVFSSDDAREMVRLVLGQNAANLYDVCPHAAGKADFFRAVYLMQYGGVYIDADEYSRDGIDRAFTLEGSDLLLTYTEALTSCMNNWFVGAAPQLPVLQLVVSNILDNLESFRRKSTDRSVWLLTGPGVWTLTIIDFILDPLSRYDRMSVDLIEEKIYRRHYNSPDMPYKTSPEGNWRLSR